ncbi:MAG: signal peptide peptidase SppA [Burkholderiaceae bacterium]|nr:signal peptide peptidase SppA [Burkholderiaceae bacterium]
MASSILGFIGRCFGVFWRALDATRRAFFNLVFLLFLVLLLTVFIAGGPRRLNDKTALLLDLKGNLVEQYPGSVRRTMLGQLGASVKDDVQLRDVLQVLDAAAKDPKIGSVVLVLDEFQGAGLPMLRDVGAALDRFKASGKKVVAWGSSYNQRQYFLAIHADKIYLHPMGMVALEGFGGYRNYYHDALDKLGVTVNVMKVGAYKNFAEPFTENAPSAEAVEAESALYNDMWAYYTGTVEKARHLEAGSIMRTINDLPQLMKEAHGDPAKIALSEKWVDGLKTRDEMRQLMLAIGAKDEKAKTFRQIGFEEYQARQRPRFAGDAIGVVIAAGSISDGMAPAGSIGGLSTANLIRNAREDDRIKTIVLRINSPGGSSFGSELIRRELELTRAAGKPVVVSMGDVAASGGYWISMAADEVIADPASVTGSIGVFAILPTADKAMDKLGVHSAGVTTTWLRGSYDPTRPLDPRMRDLVQAGVERIYGDFTSKAAHARKLSADQIEAVAQGRVWSGRQAKERGLVDTIGGYQDALQSAAKRAGLGDNYRVIYLEREPTGFERVARLFDAADLQALARLVDMNSGAWQTGLAGLPGSALHGIADDFSWLTEAADEGKPFTTVTHCFCTPP